MDKEGSNRFPVTHLVVGVRASSLGDGGALLRATGPEGGRGGDGNRGSDGGRHLGFGGSGEARPGEKPQPARKDLLLDQCHREFGFAQANGCEMGPICSSSRLRDLIFSRRSVVTGPPSSHLGPRGRAHVAREARPRHAGVKMIKLFSAKVRAPSNPVLYRPNPIEPAVVLPRLKRNIGHPMTKNPPRLPRPLVAGQAREGGQGEGRLRGDGAEAEPR